MFVHPPKLDGLVHVALVTGPAQVWFAAGTAAAAGVSADRILFLPDNPKSILLPAIRRVVDALGGVMWSDEASLAWFVRPRPTRVLWVNKTDAIYALNATRATDPGTVIQYADGFVAPLLVVTNAASWSETFPDGAGPDVPDRYRPDLLAVSNIFGNFSALPRLTDLKVYEVPVQTSQELLDLIRRRAEPRDPAGSVRLLLATTVHSSRYRLRHGKPVPGLGDDGTTDGEMALYQALLERLPPVDGRALSIHPRTAPDRRDTLTGIAEAHGWRVLDNGVLAEELLDEPGASVIAPPSSILFTSSRLCQAEPRLIGHELLDLYLGDWWRETDLGADEVNLCAAAGMTELGRDFRI